MKNEKEEKKKLQQGENLRAIVGKMKKLKDAIEDYIDNMELDAEDDEKEDGDGK